MKFLVTGAKGFIGRNLVVALRRAGGEVAEIDIDSPPETLLAGVRDAAAVFHLAGVNRPERDEDFFAGNVGSLESLFSAIDQVAVGAGARRPVIVLSSSSQAGQDNSYGRSKLAAEQALHGYSINTNAPAVIFRLPGVFGKWCRPNYNSVVATFCHNIARDIPIQISDPSREIELVHVDDVVSAFLGLIEEKHEGAVFSEVAPVFKIKLGELAEKLYEFRKSRETLRASDLSDPFIRRLFGTFMSYLPSDGFDYGLERKADSRGVLAEILKANGHGQFFVSRTKAGITRGNHYHDRKVEKFLVLEGAAIIRFRNLATGEKVEYPVRGEELNVVDIPPGWTHSIQNVGATEMIVLFWASEVLDAGHHDTYPAEV